VSDWGCRETRDRLVEAVDGRLDAAASVRLHAHIESCAACRERAALWRNLTPALRALEPEPPSAMGTRRMQIEIERQLARAVVAPRRRWRWIWAPTALGLAGAAAAALLWFQHPIHPRGATADAFPERFATLARLTGTVTFGGRALAPSAAIPVGSTLALTAGSEADLAMDRGTVVHLAGPAHVALAGTAAAVTLRLDDGALSAAVAHRLAGETFAVVTPDARVDVRGTRFTVVKGREGSTVRVDEGRVFVQFVDGHSRFVSAGESAASFEPAEQPPAPSSELPGPPEPTVLGAPSTHAPTCAVAMRACRETTGAVRASMREGDPNRGLRILAEHGRATSDLEPRCGGDDLGACQDELRYLRAEALNEAGRLDDAIAAYHALDRRTAPPAMRQNALYAAAQIERRRGHDGAARADYERALDASPRGALREETLIGAMETAQASGDPRRAGALARRYLGEFPNGIGAPSARRLASSPR